jgi:hypothetical protein
MQSDLNFATGVEAMMLASCPEAMFELIENSFLVIKYSTDFDGAKNSKKEYGFKSKNKPHRQVIIQRMVRFWGASLTLIIFQSVCIGHTLVVVVCIQGLKKMCFR